MSLNRHERLQRSAVRSQRPILRGWQGKRLRQPAQSVYHGVMENLEGKIALVTGASRGIGRAIAVALAGAGADIAVNFGSHAAEAAEVQSHILGLGRRCVTIQADVSRSDDVARLVSETENRLGAIDILINNAGISRPQAIEEITEQDWDEVITVNLKSCFW